MQMEVTNMLGKCFEVRGRQEGCGWGLVCLWKERQEGMLKGHRAPLSSSLSSSLPLVSSQREVRMVTSWGAFPLAVRGLRSISSPIVLFTVLRGPLLLHGSGEGINKFPQTIWENPNKYLLCLLASQFLPTSVPFFIPWAVVGIVWGVYQKPFSQLCSMPILSHPIISNLERILQHLKQNIFGKVCNPALPCSNQKNVLELLYVQFLRLSMCAGFILLLFPLSQLLLY